MADTHDQSHNEESFRSYITTDFRDDIRSMREDLRAIRTAADADRRERSEAERRYDEKLEMHDTGIALLRQAVDGLERSDQNKRDTKMGRAAVIFQAILSGIVALVVGIITWMSEQSWLTNHSTKGH
jgi:hypothetical protein